MERRLRLWAAKHLAVLSLHLSVASLALCAVAYVADYNAAAATRENELDIAPGLVCGAGLVAMLFATPPGIFLYFRLSTGLWFSVEYLEICSTVDLLGFRDAPVPKPAGKAKKKKKRRQPVIRPQPMPFETPPRPSWEYRCVNTLIGSLSRVPGRYHLDKSVHEALAAKLRRHGLDVTTAAEAGLIGASAAQSLAYAAKGRRVLISFDPVFLSLHETDAVHANIIHVRDGKKIWNAEVLRVALRMAGEIAKP